VAQDEERSPVYVTGTTECTVVRPATSCEVTNAVEHCRGQLADCVEVMSDPRVSGTFRNEANSDCLGGGGCLYWGTHVLDEPDGGWDCAWSGLEDPYPASGNDGLVRMVCLGTGPYEGLTYTTYHVWGPTRDFGDGTDQKGLIYADELPSLAPPAVTAE
jgi:hypothetical protein